MNCGTQKAVRLLKELDVKTGIGLIEKKRLGLGKPNVIYVKNFMIKDEEGEKQQTEQKQSRIVEIEELQDKTQKLLNDENQNSEIVKIANQEDAEDVYKRQGILFVVDTAQSAGVIPISMKEDNIDILCFTGHKGLMGPQGIGGICIRKGVEIRPLKTGGTGILSFSKTQPGVLPQACLLYTSRCV